MAEFTGSIGNYSLSNGSLTVASNEFVGVSGTAIFSQSGGTHQATAITIGSHSSFSLTGGTLTFTGGLANDGTFTLGGSAIVHFGGLVNLGHANILSPSNVTLNGNTSNSLLILPAGTQTSAFKSFSSNAGNITAFAGSPITIPAAATIAAGSGNADDLIICAGTLTGSAVLNGGISVQGASANAAVATLNVDNPSSGISGGQLTVNYENVGVSGAGTFTQSAGTHSVTTLTLGATAGAIGTFLLNSGQLTASSSEIIGSYGTGNFTQSGGTHAPTYLTLARFASGTASYSLTNGQLNLTSLTIGSSGNATFNQSGGSTNATANMYLANNTGSVATVSLTGGTLTATVEFIGVNGTATFNQSAGANTLTSLNIGPNSSYSLTGGTLQFSAGLANTGNFALGGNAILNVGGMVNLGHATLSNISQVSLAATTANSLIILPAGTNTANFASFDNSNGMTVYAGSPITIPAGATIDAGSGNADDLINCSGTLTGSATLNGGILVQDPAASASTGSIYVNNTASGVSNGQLTTSAPIVVGYSAAGAFTLSNGTINAKGEIVGLNGVGSFLQTGGTQNITAGLLPGSSPNNYSFSLVLGYSASGTYSLANGQLGINGSEAIGFTATGAFSQSGGTHTVSRAIYLGYNTGVSGSLDISNGSLTTFIEDVGYGGNGAVTQSGGTHTVSSTLTLGYLAGSTGSYSLSGTAVLNAKIIATGKGTGTLSISGGSATITGSLSILGAGSSAVVSGGSLSVPTVNVTAGDFSHTGGTLNVTSLNNSGNLFLNAPATIDTINLNGGTLSGHGTISGQALAGAAPHTIAPSATLPATSTGTLTLGSLTTNANTTLALNLLTPGTNDALNITTNNGLNLSGGKIQIANVPSNAASLGYYKIIQYAGAIQGTGLSSLSPPAAVGSITYSLDATKNPGFITLHRGFLGDANDDGAVTFADFVQLSNNFGQSNTGWSGGDFNNDDVTNFADFVELSNNFGLSISGGAFTATPDQLAEMSSFMSSGSPVPEPASLLLLVPALMLIARKKP